jgi:hypothetical protein
VVLGRARGVACQTLRVQDALRGITLYSAECHKEKNMLTLQYAKDPFFQTEDKSCIHITVKWEEFNEEMPFGAMASDIYEHGRDVYARALAGEFGEVKPYTKPVGSQTQPVSTGAQTL